MNIPKREWLQILILAAPFCVAALLWNKLPDRMPDHWGINGQVNGYSSKPVATLLLPCINLAVAVLILILPRIDPKFARYDEETQASLRRTFGTMRLAVTLFLSLVTMAVTANPLYPAIRVPTVNIFGAGLLLMVFGNLMTKLRPNWLYGIRTRWTLESRDVWIKTHRLGGRLMMAGGACILIFGLLLPMKLFVICVLLPAIVVMGIVPIVYSYHVWNRSRPAK
jgi:immunity protein, SdpI family